MAVLKGMLQVSIWQEAVAVQPSWVYVQAFVVLGDQEEQLKGLVNTFLHRHPLSLPRLWTPT
jgi:hypothetical protein